MDVVENTSKKKVMIRLLELTKKFGDTAAVDNVSLDIYEQEFLFLLGPSGSGKTTILRMIGGYEQPTEGTIEIDGRVVNDVPINKRDIGMVFQSYALFPHKTVADNVGFGLKVRGVPKKERMDKVIEALDLVRLPGLEKRYPHQLSGGQQQRVALARVLAYHPSLLILDEPLANLDKRLRDNMRVELKRLQEKVGITTIFVTHDQEEALTMADRIAVIDGGKLIQVGTPSDIYNCPECSFVATFIGETNFFEGEICNLEGVCARVKVEGDWEVLVNGQGEFRAGEKVALSIRSERIHLARETGGVEADNIYAGKIEFCTYFGAQVTYLVRLKDGAVLKVSEPTPTGVPAFRINDDVHLYFDANQVVCLQEKPQGSERAKS